MLSPFIVILSAPYQVLSIHFFEFNNESSLLECPEIAPWWLLWKNLHHRSAYVGFCRNRVEKLCLDDCAALKFIVFLTYWGAGSLLCLSILSILLQSYLLLFGVCSCKRKNYFARAILGSSILKGQKNLVAEIIRWGRNYLSPFYEILFYIFLIFGVVISIDC